MIYILYILLILIIILILILMSKGTIGIVLRRVDEDDYIAISLELLFGVIKRRYELPYLDIIFNRKMRPGLKIKKSVSTKKKKGTTETGTIFGTSTLIETYKKLKENFSLYDGIIHYIISNSTFDSIRWHTEIGAGEANLTALAVGAAWLFKGNVLGFILNHKNVKNIDINVVPNYSRGTFQMNLHCIIRMKIANIINVVIKSRIIQLKKAKLSKGSEGNERASNSGLNENHNG